MAQRLNTYFLAPCIASKQPTCSSYATCFFNLLHHTVFMSKLFKSANISATRISFSEFWLPSRQRAVFIPCVPIYIYLFWRLSYEEEFCSVAHLAHLCWRAGWVFNVGGLFMFEIIHNAALQLQRIIFCVRPEFGENGRDSRHRKVSLCKSQTLFQIHSVPLQPNYAAL